MGNPFGGIVITSIIVIILAIVCLLTAIVLLFIPGMELKSIACIAVFIALMYMLRTK